MLTDPKLQAQMIVIMDCFTGADGGTGFIKFQSFIEEMDQRSKAGDVDAAKIVAVMSQFARLIQLASK